IDRGFDAALIVPYETIISIGIHELTRLPNGTYGGFSASPELRQRIEVTPVGFSDFPIYRCPPGTLPPPGQHCDLVEGSERHGRALPPDPLGSEETQAVLATLAADASRLGIAFDGVFPAESWVT